MKITEISWEDGKKYTAYFSSSEHTVIVESGELYSIEGSKCLVDIAILEEILNGNYEEVIEPVDYKTAIEDCKKNPQIEYKSTGDDLNLMQVMRNIDGYVTIKSSVKNSCRIDCIIDCMWIRKG